MWLLEATSLKLHWFHNGAAPRYAILSHTWGDEEVTFQELKAYNEQTLRCPAHCTCQPVNIQQRRGFQKIQFTARQALKDNLGWAWVDTCCIDKSSSAELSEAINSMFVWYAQAVVCYALLEDITGPDEPQSTITALERNKWTSASTSSGAVPIGSRKYSVDLERRLSRCKWFERGW
jgi:hypothetical protein